MPVNSLGQLLVLLCTSVLIIALTRRLRLPVILGYLIVGVLVGPHALGVLSGGEETRAIAEIGVVLLLFTLGLEFSFPRMVAMRREVFGLGSAQTAVIAAAGALIVHAAGVGWASAIAVGGAMTTCSTAIVLQQLGDQDELDRTHGRLSFAVLLFQDLAFVPLLALATVLAQGTAGVSGAAGAAGATAPSGAALLLRLVLLGTIALAVVLLIGRWIVRPLLREIAHSRLRELFTLAALLVVLTSAWITERLGLSMALGAFLSGMLLAESEYSHQIDAAIRPFRELLLGLFFISVGMLLDWRVLVGHLALIVGLLALLLLAKALLSALTVRLFGIPRFKAVRTGLVLAGGGELGVALLTILAEGRQLVARGITQLLLAVVVLGMIVSPLVIRYNKRIARFVLREHGPPATAVPREYTAAVAASELAQREHVLLCGFGRVGRNLARVLASQGFEYLAMDLDPDNVHAARLAGEPVVWGDSADEQLLRNLGLAHATVVIISFADPDVAIGIVRAVRHLRADVPVLVRVQDDARLAELSLAGATEVVPETLEASLTLVSQALTLLQLPPAQVLQVVGGIRRARYATLRSLAASQQPSRASTAAPSAAAAEPTQAPPPLSPLSSLGSVARLADTAADAKELQRSIVLPPGAWAVGRRLAEARARGAAVTFTAVRRQGIVGREPAEDTELREGDVVVISGLPAALEHAEALLLAG
ncbi:MAG TPA: cation:proton antiporter [Steroidobacteraceae bacterium]|nr:cation:proton antiporter [Steroidobacteraceae bacterium]